MKSRFPMTRGISAALTAALLTSASIAGAAVLLDSGLTTNASSSLDNGAGKAVAFTTGPAAYSLDSVVVRLEFQGTTQPSSTIGIYSGSTAAGFARPTNTQLVSFAQPTLLAGTSDYTLTPAASFTLQANTTYWFVIYNPTDVTTFGWNYETRTDSSTITTSAGYTVPADLASTAGNQFGGVFRQLSEATGSPGGWTGVSGAAYNSLRINGTVIPEPSVAAVAGLGLALTLRRKRVH